MAKKKKQDIEVLSDYPYVAIVHDLLTHDECLHIIEASKGKLVRSTVDGPTEQVDQSRTSSQAWLDYVSDDLIRQIGERVSNLVEIPISHAEPMQVVYYKEGEHYAPHHDAYDIASVEGARATRGWGQRYKTALLYLNDVAEGGETYFPQLDITITPKKGSMVIFQNVDPEDDSIPLYSSLHAALPVKSGFKWACNIWFHKRDQRYQGSDFIEPSQHTLTDEECVRMLETMALGTKDTHGEHSAKMQYIADRFQQLIKNNSNEGFV